MNERRRLIVLVLAAAIGTAHAQVSGRPARIGILSGNAPGTETMRFLDPIRLRLAELGRVEGRNLEIEYRFAEGRAERWPALAAELLALQPDVLVGVGSIHKAAAAATKSVPVVALLTNDPVADGLVQSLARPGGNVTGVSSWGVEMVAKRLQLLKELAPDVRRVGILASQHQGPPGAAQLQGFERQLGITIVVASVGSAEQIDGALAMLARERVGGIVVYADPLFYIERVRIAAWCQRSRLQSVWGHRTFLDAGGLASYQSDFAEAMRRGADQIHKILNGADPGEIPFERTTKLDLAVSVKAASALGIVVPKSVLVSADLVIE